MKCNLMIAKAPDFVGLSGFSDNYQRRELTERANLITLSLGDRKHTDRHRQLINQILWPPVIAQDYFVTKPKIIKQTAN